MRKLCNRVGKQRTKSISLHICIIVRKHYCVSMIS